MSTSRTDAIAFDPSQVLHLLEQGANGHHVLFDTHQIRRALANKADSNEPHDAVDALHRVVAELVRCESVVEQRAVIYSLPQWLQDLTVRMYFHFLDRYLKEQALTWH